MSQYPTKEAAQPRSEHRERRRTWRRQWSSLSSTITPTSARNAAISAIHIQNSQASSAPAEDWPWERRTSQVHSFFAPHRSIEWSTARMIEIPGRKFREKLRGHVTISPRLRIPGISTVDLPPDHTTSCSAKSALAGAAMEKCSPESSRHLVIERFHARPW